MRLGRKKTAIYGNCSCRPYMVLRKKGIVGCVLVSKSGCAKLAKQCQWRRTNSAEPTCQQQRRLLLKQVGLEMTLMHLKT